MLEMYKRGGLSYIAEKRRKETLLTYMELRPQKSTSHRAAKILGTALGTLEVTEFRSNRTLEVMDRTELVGPHG
uniref:Uncharacterized protein n=1 Tax=Romanomermis culicivorax TaxID=13658 RepID=A0A915ISF0_ROMCU